MSPSPFDFLLILIAFALRLALKISAPIARIALRWHHVALSDLEAQRDHAPWPGHAAGVLVIVVAVVAASVGLFMIPLIVAIATSVALAAIAYVSALIASSPSDRRSMR